MENLTVRYVFLLGLIGCSAQPEAATRSAVDARQLRGLYPESRYVVGLGEGTAGDLSGTAARARASVAQQIQSRIESSVELVASEVVSNGLTQARERRVEQIRQLATFDRAELIHVDSKLSGCNDGGCWAVAYLERTSAAAELVQSLRIAAAAQRAAVSEALQNAESFLIFTPLLRRADTLYEHLLAAALPLNGILGIMPPELREGSKLREELERARTRALAGVRVTVFATGADKPIAERVSGAVTGALRQSGIQAQQDERCHTGLSLAPLASLHCKRAFIGFQCEVTVEMSVRDCSNDLLIRSTVLSGWSASGADVRDEAVARARALDAVSSERLSDPLSRSLADMLPF